MKIVWLSADCGIEINIFRNSYRRPITKFLRNTKLRLFLIYYGYNPE